MFIVSDGRTLSLANKDMDGVQEGDEISTDGYTLIDVFGIKDPVRPGVRQTFQTCISAGINVRMVTGDNINTAKAITRECGILTDDVLAIDGSKFRSKSPKELKNLIPKLQVMARSLPLDKHTLVTILRIMGEVVVVTGDGTNDDPALHEADIGLTMGIAGTEAMEKKKKGGRYVNKVKAKTRRKMHELENPLERANADSALPYHFSHNSSEDATSKLRIC